MFNPANIKTAEMLQAEAVSSAQAKINEEAKAYLLSTDYINHKYKEEVELTASITHDAFMLKYGAIYTARAAARASIQP